MKSRKGENSPGEYDQELVQSAVNAYYPASAAGCVLPTRYMPWRATHQIWFDPWFCVALWQHPQMEKLEKPHKRAWFGSVRSFRSPLLVGILFLGIPLFFFEENLGIVVDGTYKMDSSHLVQNHNQAFSHYYIVPTEK